MCPIRNTVLVNACNVYYIVIIIIDYKCWARARYTGHGWAEKYV